MDPDQCPYSVADPDPNPDTDPSDQHVLGLPDPDPDPPVKGMDHDPDPALDPDHSIILLFYSIVTLFYFLSLKNNENVASKLESRKNCLKKNFFC